MVPDLLTRIGESLKELSKILQAGVCVGAQAREFFDKRLYSFGDQIEGIDIAYPVPKSPELVHEADRFFGEQRGSDSWEFSPHLLEKISMPALSAWCRAVYGSSDCLENPL